MKILVIDHSCHNDFLLRMTLRSVAENLKGYSNVVIVSNTKPDFVKAVDIINSIDNLEKDSFEIISSAEIIMKKTSIDSLAKQRNQAGYVFRGMNIPQIKQILADKHLLKINSSHVNYFLKQFLVFRFNSISEFESTISPGIELFEYLSNTNQDFELGKSLVKKHSDNDYHKKYVDELNTTQLNKLKSLIYQLAFYVKF